jgi:hypothetical protein
MNIENYAGRSFGALLTLALAVLSVPSQADEAIRLDFTTHASFFSAETHQPKPLDPHVFVADASAAAAVGPQNIQHVAGIRPALIDQDPRTAG